MVKLGIVEDIERALFPRVRPTLIPDITLSTSPTRLIEPYVYGEDFRFVDIIVKNPSTANYIYIGQENPAIYPILLLSTMGSFYQWPVSTCTWDMTNIWAYCDTGSPVIGISCGKVRP